MNKVLILFFVCVMLVAMPLYAKKPSKPAPTPAVLELYQTLDYARTPEAKMLSIIRESALQKSVAADAKTKERLLRFELIKREAEKQGRISPDGRIVFYYQIVTGKSQFPDYYNDIPNGLRTQDVHNMGNTDLEAYTDLVENKAPLQPQSTIVNAAKRAIKNLSPWFEFKPADELHAPQVVIAGSTKPSKVSRFADTLVGGDLHLIRRSDAFKPFRQDIRVFPEGQSLKAPSAYELMLHELMHATIGLRHIKEEIVETPVFVERFQKATHKRFDDTYKNGIFALTVVDNLNASQQEKLGLTPKDLPGLQDILILEQATKRALPYEGVKPIVDLGSKELVLVDARGAEDEATFMVKEDGPQRSIIKTEYGQWGERSYAMKGKMFPASYVVRGKIENIKTISEKDDALMQINVDSEDVKYIHSEKGNIRIALQAGAAGRITFEDTDEDGQEIENFVAKVNAKQKSIFNDANGDALIVVRQFAFQSVEQEGEDIILTLKNQATPLVITLKDQAKPGHGIETVVLQTENGFGAIAGEDVNTLEGWMALFNTEAYSADANN